MILNKNPELIKSLDWRTFEILLAEILESLGYEIELTKQTHDGGIDIIAIKKNEIWGAHRYLLQAKRSKNLIGVDPLRNLLFLQSHYKATKVCLATTSSFTKGAWELAKQYQWQLELKDYYGIQDWIQKVIPLKK